MFPSLNRHLPRNGPFFEEVPSWKCFVPGKVTRIMNTCCCNINRRMFISVCGPSPKILKLFMDGSSNMTLVEQGLKCPTSLTFDQKSQRLFWIDIPRNKVESVMTNNANRKVLYLDARASPIGFTLNADYAYVTDAEIGRIYRMGLHSESNVTLATALKKPTMIRYFNKNRLMNGNAVIGIIYKQLFLTENTEYWR